MAINAYFATLLSLLLVPSAFPEQKSSTLQLVQVILRHGVRPTGDFPTNPNKNAYPLGPNEMPALGQQQGYEMGLLLRKRYAGFLNELYIADELYVRSDDEDRCLQTVSCCLAGLYPPVGVQVWNKDIRWQPIPIHSMPLENDPYLKVTKTKCKTLKHESTNPLATNASFYAWVAEKAGYSNMSVAQAIDLFTALEHAKLFGKVVPAWANDTVFNTLDELKYVTRTGKYNSAAKGKIFGGLLLGEIIKRMEVKACTNFSAPGKVRCETDKSLHLKKKSKLHIYSGQDSTIMAVLGAMKLLSTSSLQPIPETGGALIVELHKRSAKDYRVEIHYQWQRNMSEPEKLTVPGCSQFACAIGEFVNALKDTALYSVDAWKAACNPVKSITDDSADGSNSDK